MPLASLEKGRRTEREVARILCAWARGYYEFRRRGLGHAGVGDLVVRALRPDLPEWPFVVQVKAGAPPTLGLLLRDGGGGALGRWWADLDNGQAEPWLVWKAHYTWLLTFACTSRLEDLTHAGPLSSLYTRFGGRATLTVALEAFLARVSVAFLIEALRRRPPSLEAFVERGRAAQDAIDRLTGAAP